MKNNWKHLSTTVIQPLIHSLFYPSTPFYPGYFIHLVDCILSVIYLIQHKVMDMCTGDFSARITVNLSCGKWCLLLSFWYLHSTEQHATCKVRKTTQTRGSNLSGKILSFLNAYLSTNDP